MTMHLTHNPAQPAYVTHINHTGSRWQRWWLDKVLRMAIKHNFRYDADIETLRRKQDKLDNRMTRLDPAMRVTHVDANGVPCDWLDMPGARADKVLFYIHGGAWMFKFPKLHHAMAADLGRGLAARVLMVDYRLAPQHRFPAGADDCLAAWQWLRAQGYAAHNIVMAGDSAGGNLTLATLQRLRRAQEAMPACGVMLSPFTDFTLSSASMVTNEKSDPMFSAAAMVGLRHNYLDPAQMLDPLASPLFGDFAGLPPLLFQSSASEMLRDESLRAAARAHATGVAVEVELWAGLPHVFQSMQKLTQSRAALARIVDFVQRHTPWSTPAIEATPAALTVSGAPALDYPLPEPIAVHTAAPVDSPTA